MFTGIVDHCGCVLHVVKQAEKDLELTIRSQFSDLVIGESIAVDGTCLSVTRSEGNIFSCTLSAETIDKTIAHQYEPGRSVNLERSLRVNDRLGGHFVMGHVDQTVVIEKRESYGSSFALQVGGIWETHFSYLISKGSVALNGISLTINVLSDAGFSVMIIPQTQEKTNIGAWGVGSSVNLECDWLAKVIHKQMHPYQVTGAV